MKSVSQLEKELQQAKNKEKLTYLQKELAELKEQFEGKAFGTHSFERKNRSVYNTADFYEKFWIAEDGQIHMLRWRLHIIRMGKNYKFKQDSLSFNREKQEVVSDNNGYNAYHNLMSYRYNANTEISLEKFMALWEKSKIVCDGLFEVYKENVDSEPVDVLTIGSSNDEKNLAEAFDYLKLDVIDITKHQKLFEAIQYKQLPFLQEQKYLPRIYAKEILEYQIKLWEKELSDTWRAYNNYTAKRIDMVKEFIKNNL